VVNVCGMVVWVNAQGDAGVRFEYIPAAEKAKLEQWLGDRFDQAVAALRGRLQSA